MDANPLPGSQPTDHPTRTGPPPVEGTLSYHADTPVSVDAPPGYAVERELKAGGMGVVFLARQVGLNRPCALKLVKGAADARALIRFLAEAEAVAAVRHPNVVQVYAYGDHHGQPYLALEYCPGGDLTTLRDEPEASATGANWFRRVAELMAGVAAGVNAAHLLGIVHRDLKPHNVLLTADGTPKVADFGLAKRGGGTDMTESNAVLGTPAYMAPEQAGGGTKFVGPEADVWALGVMLYELCSGSRPIDTSGPVHEAIARVITADIPPLRSRCPAVPTDVALIAHKCLAQDPRDRYPTAGGLAADLNNWLAGNPISARPAGLVESAVKWAKRNKRLAAMAAAVLLTMAVATGVSLGFGLEANKQAGIAKDEKGKAEDKAEEASAERKNALAEKRNAQDAAAREKDEREHTQRALAKALLGPISADWRRDDLNEYEQTALWKLADLRNGPIGGLVLDESGSSSPAARQFHNRGEYLLHAVVGLNRKRQTEVDGWVAARLRSPDVPPEVKRNLALAAVRSEQSVPPGEMPDALLATLTETRTEDEWEPVAKEVAALAGRLPADRAADLLLLALGRQGSGAFFRMPFAKQPLAKALAAATADLPPDKAVAALLTALTMAMYPAERAELAAGMAAACARLPADDAADLLLRALGKADPTQTATLANVLETVAARLPADKGERVAEGLHAALKKSADPQEGEPLAAGLAAVCGRLPAEQGTDRLLAALATTREPKQRQHLAAGLTAALPRLPNDKAAAVCGKAADALLVAFKKADYHDRALAAGLAAVCGRLPADKSLQLCEGAADGLVAALGKATDATERRELAVGMAAVSAGLPADKAAEVLLAALRKGTHAEERRALAAGLASAGGRLPAEKGAEVCATAADLLRAALGKATDANERRELAGALAAVCERLPADKAAEALTTSLEKSVQPEEGAKLAAGLCAVCPRLPADKASDLMVSAYAKAKSSYERQALIDGLVSVAARLPAEKVAGLLLVPIRSGQLQDERGAWVAGVVAASERLPTDKASALLLTAADNVVQSEGGATLSAALAAVGGRMPAQQAAELLTAAMNRSKFHSQRRELAVGLAAVAGGLPADKAAEVCGATADRLALLLGGVTNVGPRRDLAVGLVAVCARLPADQAAARLLAALEKAQPDDRALFAGLAVVGGRVPPDRAADLLLTALQKVAAGPARRELADGLAAVAAGLTGGESTRRRHAPAVAALTGVTALHPEVQPKPKPLPPQQLVELLKHPFCVKEVRRAVLDALEFTYDRQFTDLWAFVKFAEMEHPELDLLTPPRRPAEKK